MNIADYSPIQSERLCTVGARGSRRPVIVGMNHPSSDDLGQALSARVRGTSGFRLWSMLNNVSEISESQYHEIFERINLVPGLAWDEVQAKVRAAKLMRGLAGRDVVVLGKSVQSALGLKFSGWFEPSIRSWLDAEDMRYWVIPHPSGLCRSYNDPSVRAAAGELLASLILA